MDLSQFPAIVLVEIFKNLDNKSKFQIALTCKNFNEIIKMSPEVYKTFKMRIHENERQFFHIDQITRPIPSLNIQRSLTRRLLPFLLRYLENQGKYLKDVRFKYVEFELQTLIKVLNLIPNVEKLYICLSGIEKTTKKEDPEPVRNRFLQLKSLKLYFSNHFKKSDLPLLDIFYEFFKDSKEITELRLSHHLNLFYNKPKLEKMYVANNCSWELTMDEASESNVICGNLKKVWIEGGAIHYLKNLEAFVLSNKAIEEISFADTGEDMIFENILNHVLELNSLKKFQYFDGPLYYVQLTKVYPNIEEISTNCLMFQLNQTSFPNVKKLQLVDSLRNNTEIIVAINQLQLLEELTFIRGCAYDNLFLMQLPNLKKLMIEDNNIAVKLMETIAKNCPNITDLTLDSQNLISREKLKNYVSVIEKFKNLKKLSCSFHIDEYNFEQIDYFGMFLEAGKRLEKFEVHLIKTNMTDKLQEGDEKILETLEPFVQLEPEDYQTCIPRQSEIFH